MTLSSGPATDYIYGKAQLAVTGMTVEGQAFVAVDGVPATVTLGSFVVGLEEPPPAEVGETLIEREFIGLPASHVQEAYTIPCYIDVRVPGTTQKTARDLAQAAFNAFWPLIKADLTLGGVLAVGEAQIETLTEVPSNVGTEAEPGRRHLIKFGVHCMNRTT